MYNIHMHTQTDAHTHIAHMLPFRFRKELQGAVGNEHTASTLPVTWFEQERFHDVS